MKNKIIILIDVLMVFVVILGVVFFTIKNNENNELKDAVKSASAELAYEKKSNSEKTSPNGVNTPDEIRKIKHEIEDAEISTEKGLAEVKQNVLNYINILYNTAGDFKANKEKILSSLEPYTTQSLRDSTLERMFSVGTGNGRTVATEKKQIQNFCTENDVYISVEEYEDGSNSYMAFCELHFENLAQYHLITVTSYSGKALINSDTIVSAQREFGGLQ